MTDGQNNYVNMTDAVLAAMQKYNSIWTGNAKVAAAVAAVTSVNNTIKSTAGSQAQVNQGPTTNKHNLWVIAAKKADQVCAAVKAYADDINDVTLAAAINFTYKRLLRGSANEAIISMKAIHDKAAAISINLLTPFMITAADITELQTAITDFANATPMKRVMVSNASAATGQLPTLFTTQRSQLKKLDNLMNTYRVSQPTFVETYFNARKIINLGKSQQAVELHLLPKHFEGAFGMKINDGDTFTVRNHSATDLFVYLTDTPETLPTVQGVCVRGDVDIKLIVPKDFGGVFGHWLLLYNPSNIDDVHVTVIHAHGKSASGAQDLGNVY